MNPIINQAILRDANNLIRVAQMNNAVVTITLQPLEPLAMGNYVMVADVRPVRERAATGFDLDAMCEAAIKRLSVEISADANAHKLALFSTYCDARRAIDTRYEGYRKEMRQKALGNLAVLGFCDAAAALRKFAQTISALNEKQRHTSGVTFFPPMN